MPSDRSPQQIFVDVVNTAVIHVQRWYASQLDGLTFAVQGPTPQVCSVDEPADYYEGKDGWWRVINGLQCCAPVEHHSDHHVWVVYIDADFDCSGRGELGRGGDGVTIVHRGDLDGLADPKNYRLCFDQTPRGVHGWIGGLAHELGHAFGLPHPPGCDSQLSHCDYDALMWAGYFYDYPNTYLTEDDKATLKASAFFHHYLNQ